MLVYNYDRNGFYTGSSEADESPLEQGVFLIPARATDTPPPEDIPDDKWPRWIGSQWKVVNKPKAVAENDPVEKLRIFLAQNPDVAALINPADGGANV